MLRVSSTAEASALMCVLWVLWVALLAAWFLRLLEMFPLSRFSSRLDRVAVYRFSAQTVYRNTTLLEDRSICGMTRKMLYVLGEAVLVEMQTIPVITVDGRQWLDFVCNWTYITHMVSNSIALAATVWQTALPTTLWQPTNYWRWYRPAWRIGTARQWVAWV